MKYFNIIANKITDYPYRFKTRKEFKEEYGDEWATVVRCNWFDDDYDGMNYLFGKDFKIENINYIEEMFTNNRTYHLNDEEYGHNWSITSDMIIKNQRQDFKSLYLKDKQNVYEGIITKINDFN